MELYKKKETFIELIRAASSDWGIDEALIEKDYFVMLVLRELNKAIPGLLFKGGTCCSRVYHAIDRFSEDIDLSLDDEHFGRQRNKEANHRVIQACDRLGFTILNRDEVCSHSHGSFNRYYVEYPVSFASSAIKPYLQIEMSFYQRAYPSETKPVTSMIGEYLASVGREDILSSFGLEPFDVCAQTLERTFIDKVFALCDYYERGEFARNSRHIYDLYKISKRIDLGSPTLKSLIHQVREDRKKNSRSVSAQDGYNVGRTLQIILDEEPFRPDYERVTLSLLTNPLGYDVVSGVLAQIIELGLFAF